MAYGLNVGYKHFFNNKIGIRGYGAFNVGNFSQKANQWGLVDATNNTHYLIFSANLDGLFNFYQYSVFDVGAFAGIGLGGQHYRNRTRGFQSDGTNTTSLNATAKATGFYADVKLGLRLSAENHGLDLTLKVPLATAKNTFTTGAGDTEMSNKLKVRQNFQIALGYSYTF